MATMQQKILSALRAFGRHGLDRRELAKKMGLGKKQKARFMEEIGELIAQNKLLERAGRLLSLEGRGLIEGEVVKVSGTFGFARPQGAPKDVFIPGRMLAGSMPGDKVLLRILPGGGGELEEGEVVSVLEPCNRPFSGVLQVEGGVCAVLPDRAVRWPIPVVRGGLGDAKPGDKVLAEIARRGERHSGHAVRVLQSFGSAQSAAACSLAILAGLDISTVFPDEALEQARAIAAGNGIHPREIASRNDLRGDIIFTIDGADCKDMDDAVGLRRLSGGGWELGVHIADVSHYVTYRSPLDEEALRRGTSVYYADSVVPMLPTELSNDVCSLNPGEDRLAFSAMITLDDEGKMTGYRFGKSVIRSRVKGVYGELNALIEGGGDDALLQKYAEVRETLEEMRSLALICMKNRLAGGKMELDSVEGKITVDEHGEPVDVAPRERGFCERMIEEFMLLANEAAATMAEEKGLPFVYRVHEGPSPEKLEQLYEVLDRLGVSFRRPGASGVGTGLTRILENVRESRFGGVVNTLVLRSMAKARYSAQNTGHFGLALKNYAHFTSPIRRYPDLVVHRILSAHLSGMKPENMNRKYTAFAAASADASTQKEIAAMTAERDCESCYKARYMLRFIGRDFEGVVSGCTAYGAYVLLPNTCEGLVRLADFPAGDWTFDGSIAFSNRVGGKSVMLGDTVTVRVLGADVPAGQIDFAMV